MGSFRDTGGSSFREMMRRTLRLWASGGWITTCFIETDRNEIAVAFLSSRPAALNILASFPKKGSWVDRAAVLLSSGVAKARSTAKPD